MNSLIKEKENKDRLTITLSPSILKKVDSMIDGQHVRNRSHAIELILSQHILSRVTKVVVLAGGKKSATVHKATHSFPKAMLPVQDKPLIEHTISSLVRAGLKDITLVIGHLGSKIEYYFEDGSRFGAHITYVTDLEESGTAQAIALVKDRLDTEPFLLVYGDVLAQIDWMSLIDFHDRNTSLITTAVTTVTETQPWGVVSMEGNRIVRFDEKPRRVKENEHLINAGIYVVDPQVVARITPEMRSFEHEVVPKIVQEGQMSGYHFSGQWFDVGSAAVYTRALEEWRA